MIVEMVKKYQYHNGTPARILCVDACNQSDPEFTIVSIDSWGELHRHRASGIEYKASQWNLVPVPEKQPLTTDDVPPGSAIRRKGQTDWLVITQVSFGYFYCGVSKFSPSTLFHAGYEINRNDGKGWVACEK